MTIEFIVMTLLFDKKDVVIIKYCRFLNNIIQIKTVRKINLDIKFIKIKEKSSSILVPFHERIEHIEWRCVSRWPRTIRV